MFDDYADRTGARRSKDIASIPADSRRAGSDQSGHPSRPCDAILEGKAEALRKVNPSLTREQAFAGSTQIRANAEIAQIERAANEARFAEQAAFSYRADNMEADLALAKRDNAHRGALEGKAAELRKPHPGLTPSRRLSRRSIRTRQSRSSAAAERQSARGGPVRLIE